MKSTLTSKNSVKSKQTESGSDFTKTKPFSRNNAFAFRLPPSLEAGEPPEARGLSRDQVRLMVSYRKDNQIVHTSFRHLPDFLDAGDLLVINTSKTLNAALNATLSDGTAVELHLSTHLPADLWVVELRLTEGDGTQPYGNIHAGERVQLEDGGWVILLTTYRADQRMENPGNSLRRLWIAELHIPEPLDNYLQKYGFPIRYRYVHGSWPLEYYQTVYATEPGSAEMPSAGRAFSNNMITSLVAKGIQIAPLLLHTGVASLEDHEPPYEEYYRVPVETAQRVNVAHATSKRVIAVGTTVVRALETVTTPGGETAPGEGWTNLVITPQRGVYSVDGLLTGFHEPKSSHLAMLGALAGEDHLRITYAQAIDRGYLWHEFGDLHLIL